MLGKAMDAYNGSSKIEYKNPGVINEAEKESMMDMLERGKKEGDPNCKTHSLLKHEDLTLWIFTLVESRGGWSDIPVLARNQSHLEGKFSLQRRTDGGVAQVGSSWQIDGAVDKLKLHRDEHKKGSCTPIASSSRFGNVGTESAILDLCKGDATEEMAVKMNATDAGNNFIDLILNSRSFQDSIKLCHDRDDQTESIEITNPSCASCSHSWPNTNLVGTNPNHRKKQRGSFSRLFACAQLLFALCLIRCPFM